MMILQSRGTKRSDIKIQKLVGSREGARGVRAGRSATATTSACAAARWPSAGARRCGRRGGCSPPIQNIILHTYILTV